MSVCFDIFHPSRIGTISYPSILYMYQFRCLALGRNTMTLASKSLKLANLQLSHCAQHRHERLRQTLSIITLILADPGNFVRGVQVSLTKKALTTFFFFFFFLVLSLFYRSQMVNFKEIYHFLRFQIVIFQGGGGSGPPIPPSGYALDSLLLIIKTRHADNNYLHVWILKRNVSFRRFF